MTPDAAANTTPGTGPALAAGGADASSRVLHRSLAHGMPMATHAKGNYLYMSDGSRILDASGGAAVVSVGHGVPEIVDAVSKQVGTLPYVSSAVFGIEPAEDLANKMCEEAGMARVIFLSGGSEAVESAIKLCRQYHVENGEPERTKFIAREISYHGNTMGALALGRHNRRRKLYLPMMPDVFHAVSACNAWRFKQHAESDDEYVARLAAELDDKITQLGPATVAAFFAEPVVGAASGCVPFVPGYLKAMKRVCERHGVLFCLDEIMCGAGRTGMMHAWMHDGPEARPDVQTLGKGLCGGYAPLSAVLVGDKVVDVLRRGTGAFVNGYTFQSSGTGTAAGLAVYNYIKEHKLVEQCAARGELLAKLLREKVGPLKHVGDVRGMGLFWGIELVADKTTKTPFKYEDNVNGRLADAILARGVAVYHGAGSADGWDGDHIMLCPPYTITEDEVAHVVAVVADAINAIL
ncbi:hypothetical protein CcaverHIS002_0605740 [Cutaneotrichosporon cavernicola]|uniref:Aminotransferase n=1 Tax=Cutaneotrichosporon cavernicola TaxID=279322 RepID=A0AA48L8Z8_9TREE|nr:uncharacterized protein CcaverHIS019_0605200 [Cutaneotrichosporon cavernicola]BEI86287.1 hypothetical protein CcaverHIS002_0605740 [Cutaneotrichosporon cavernicola]BEI94061.1 hypothetical protein CcaverHIS019_0605200 [Cutaneotrichosporon cavernicola]BEJ01840.1 hypothetical protein CcaverHIS631_0605220 [Cutaneotrichosporon cavernicola]BEJ09605.1 hypothetical protein CcaverHIS641_0605200 [Cutaneotrichosporon cavernicola]